MATTLTALPCDEKRPASTSEMSQTPFRKRADVFRLRREVEAMNYVRSHTSISVPSIFDTDMGVDDNEEGWILMERIPGRQLDEAWPKMMKAARKPIKNCPRPETVARYRSKLSDDYCITFAHADISWENILVDPTTGSVTGIVDWEMAGFWPEWWEYRKALFGSRSQPWWRDILKQIMKEHESQTEVDMDIEMF
ncbi:hypothetical protein AK830_g7217 [Neonectria ditissima]|uniref:Aminoglycoside phosphotransferase domain-containing protein n=1 Tax=Neonectria ditissima TaxID=78410 RepID=A0A0P7BGS3_9HYPO|nr:hypothetical protein AK830_g7217 [Neonectria ditissima]